MPFDPDAFIAKYSAPEAPPAQAAPPAPAQDAAAAPSGGFDPDAFIKKYESPAAAAPVSGDEAPSEMLNTGIDVAKSLGTGVVKGTTGLAGSFGDIREMAGSLAEKLGAPADVGKRVLRGLPLFGPMTQFAPTSADINKKVTDTFGEYHKPETTYGKFAETAGEFVPSAIMGPAGVGRNAVLRGGQKMLTGAVIPGAASEAAGQMLEGTDTEPYARAAAGLLFGPKGPLHSSRPNGEITSQHLYESGNRSYRTADAMGIQYAPQGLARNADNTINQLSQTYRRSQAPQTFEILDEIAARRTPLTPRDVENYRQQLLRATRNVTQPGDVSAAWTAINRLERYMTLIPNSQVVQGTIRDANRARQLYREGRADWGAAKRMEMVEGKVMRGELNAETAYSGQNKGNAMRQSIKQLINPDPRGRSLMQKHGFNEREQASARALSRGSRAENALRDAANFLGKGHGVISAASLGAAYATDDPRYLLAVAAGRGLNALSGASTVSRANRLTSSIGERSALAARRGPRRPDQVGKAVASAIARTKMATTRDGYPYVPPEGNE